jgi:hypothetical protein
VVVIQAIPKRPHGEIGTIPTLHRLTASVIGTAPKRNGPENAMGGKQISPVNGEPTQVIASHSWGAGARQRRNDCSGERLVLPRMIATRVIVTAVSLCAVALVAPAAAGLGPCRTAAATTRDVHLFVSDVDRAARWYRENAGLTDVRRGVDQTSAVQLWFPCSAAPPV